MDTATTDLATKSGPELVEIYNSIPGVTPVKKFSSRADGAKRITRALATMPTAVIPKVETKTEEPKVEPRKRRPRAEYGNYNRPRGERIVAHRENSGRGRLIEDLKKGTDILRRESDGS